MNNLINLFDFGQSYWLDNLTREKISGGELQKRIDTQGLRGITSNPSIFNKAISKSKSYDEQIAQLVKDEKSVQEIYDALTVKDVQDACDLLKPVYKKSKGIDGFVSLEVPPHLAHDTEGTITKARTLFKTVNRSNCLIKVPGTKEGIPAIEQLLYEGININITLLFSVKRYEEVAEAYIRALQRRVKEHKKIDALISVASVFLSRIDVLTDELLSQCITSYKVNAEQSLPESLQGKAGLVTARLCYQSFKTIFNTTAWRKLEKSGAHVQRPLWASTSNKDPLYNDLRYVETIIGKDTVNTLPDETIDAFAKYGQLKENTIEDNLAEAKTYFRRLKKAGIAITFITQQLENEGIQKFTDAYNELISNLANKRLTILSNRSAIQSLEAGTLKDELKSAYSSLDEKQIPNLLFAEDPYLWKKGGKQLEEINHRLGWLKLPEKFTKHAETLKDFSKKIKDEGYTSAVLLGMGGSSLCSEVARETYGSAKGYPELFVLDNTSPEAILDLKKKINISKTLFIVASKSGNTEETLSFFHYFYEQLKQENKKRPGDNFIAITDDGTPLVKIAKEYKFRKTFLNPPDLGGRYSVLSDFGLVPMALMGIDISEFLKSARQMEISCEGIPAASNPGISLGAVLGLCQKQGRDKITFVLSTSISSFGYWVEQLLAESTGKENKGLIPVNGEVLGTPEVYTNDRVFVHLYLKSDAIKEDEQKLNNLVEAGHPLIRIELSNTLDLGGEYYRWEIAAAVSGLIIGINPFDQPNVEESKKNTADLLEAWQKDGDFKTVEPFAEKDALSVFCGKKAAQLLKKHSTDFKATVSAFTALAHQGDYIAFLPYFELTQKRKNSLQNWRNELRDELKVTTTLLGGPRYLHSTGQLHKGGPDSGLYIILVSEEEVTLAIPGEKFGFDILHHAQSLGDFRSLDNKGRRVIRINLGKNINYGLDALMTLLQISNKNTEEKS
ncbi:MAG: bifunctional transaldolase/phosoglucose isomerase [Bacteroidia bacterium]